MSDHTPLPWISQGYSPEEDGIGIIGLRTDANGAPYDQPTNGIVAWAALLPTEVESGDSSRAEANAALIVRCVNAHSDLVTALQEALEFIDNQADVVDGGYGIPAPNRAMQVAREIREALAKAGVE